MCVCVCVCVCVHDYLLMHILSCVHECVWAVVDFKVWLSPGDQNQAKDCHFPAPLPIIYGTCYHSLTINNVVILSLR